MLFGISTKAAASIASAIALVGVIFGTAAVMADDGDFGTIEAPQWKSGYAWTYDVSGELDYVYRGPDMPQVSGSEEIPRLTIKKEILNTEDFVNEGEPLYVGATTLPLGHILDGSMFGLDTGGWQELAVFPTADRQRDLAPVLAYPTYSQSCQGYDCKADGIAFGQDTPIDYIEFPLTYGKGWSDTVSFGDQFMDEADMTQLGDITEVEMVAEVGKMESVDLPVGTVDAVRLDFSYQPIGLQKALAQVRDEAAANGIHIDRLNVQLGLHEIAHYSPDHQAVVRDQFIFKALVDAKGEGFGQEFEVYVEMTGYVVSELTGSSLVGEAEHSMPDILRILNGEELIRDVEGELVDPASLYHIALDADRDRVNAAQGGRVGFTVASDAEDGIPSHHALQYVVKDGEGSIVDAGQASKAFSLDFDEPGVYTVLVAAVDDKQQAIAQDKAVVYADFRQTSHATCMAGSSLLYSDCGQAAVPARAGLDHLVLEARVNQTLPSLGQDHIRLVDADGRSHHGYATSPGVYRLELDGSEIAWDDEDGILRYMPEASLGEGVTYTVDLVYGKEVTTPTMEQEAGSGRMAVLGDWQYLGAMMAPLDATLDGLVQGDAPAHLDVDGLTDL